MSELQQRNDAFRDFLATLNPRQRDAVEKTEGPVLVIAGPGTGKTHILAARIGNILLNSDARAQNVLCLTFTDAGANAMRKRLLERIGPEAHRVPIFTFHSFCNRVIQENLEVFASGGLEPLSDLERIELVRELLEKLPVSHPLRAGRKDVYQYEAQVRGMFSNMKKEGWTPGFVRKKTDEYLRGLPENPAFIYQKNTKTAKKGEPKQALIDDQTEKMERLKATADLFPKYQTALERSGRYEYEDMLLWVNKAFKENEALLRNYQERYQYILVDEFQDTNGAQFQLLNQLLDFWETPNIFIVGDDDQSIYEFQGARLENLLRFAHQYRHGLEIIVLEENFRSTQGILDAAGKVVQHNQLRAVDKLEGTLTKSLHANTDARSQPLVHQYDTRLHELADIVLRIEALLQLGVAASEIAVLYSRHRQAEHLQTLLGKKGIPFQTKRPLNVLDVPVVQHFRQLLQYLHEELKQPFSGEPRLFRLLHAAFFDLKPLDLALVASAAASRSDHSPEPDRSPLYADGGEAPMPKGSFKWRQALSDARLLQSLRLSDPDKLARLGQQLNQWISDAANMGLPQLIERLYTQTGLLHWALQQHDKIWYLQVLHSLLDAVPSPEKSRLLARNQGNSDLGHFLQLLDSMDGNRLALPLRQLVEIEPGVQLLTAHAAKGLEFEHVFLFDCVDEAWERSSGDRRGQFALPPTLTLSGEEDALEARRRLFYVAATRAKRGLYISFAQQGNDAKALIQSQFVDETELPKMALAVPQSLLVEAQTALLLEAPKPVITLPEAAVVDALLAQFSMSVTALNRYLRCPLAFWYEDILKVPGSMSEAAAYGIAMHGALQRFFLKMKSDKQYQWPSSDSLSKIFATEMEHLRHYFSAHGFVQRLELGKENLRRVHVEQIPFWRKRAIVERRIDRVEYEGVPLTGVLDKIEWLDRGLRIVDYKTGAPDAKKTAAPSPQQPNGGDYWRQLAFYQILLENARIYPEPVEKLAISWLEPDKRGAFPIVEIKFSSAEIAFVGGLLRDTYSKIQQREFSTGCGEAECVWCGMQRERSLEGAGWRGEEEGLDD